MKCDNLFMEIFLKWGSFIKNIKTYFAYIDYIERVLREKAARGR